MLLYLISLIRWTGLPLSPLQDHLAALPLLLQKIQLVPNQYKCGGDLVLEMALLTADALNLQSADLANGTGTTTRTTRLSWNGPC